MKLYGMKPEFPDTGQDRTDTLVDKDTHPTAMFRQIVRLLADISRRPFVEDKSHEVDTQ